MALVELCDVIKEYQGEGEKVRALDGVSLSVAGGEFVALVGRSGCGKSTLLNLAGAMDFPTSGEVRIDGSATSTVSAPANEKYLTELRRHKVGFVFQSFQLLHTLTAVENVELPRLLAGGSAPRDTALDRLRAVELAGLEHRLPHQLSGGQMQRVAIARALVNSPKVLLADEPTGNLDSVTGTNILQLLLRMTREQGTATLMATHSTEAAAIADTVVTLRDGKIADVNRK
ncbi:MAG TPA: ABC transporter ATP-binding protein [Candidatus Acidoferrum sp.]|nr:ABC transporter ATP-binding protein [Candidatus Acidoferrum sp.]